jgi:chemotaxis signal transduction protein
MSPSSSPLLKRRAEALAAAAPTLVDDVTEESIVIAAIGSDRIGIPVTSAREVAPVQTGATIPGAPAWLRGVVQIRGELLSVLDLQAWWQTGSTTAGKHLLVVESKMGALAILADAIVEVRQLRSHEVADSLTREAALRRPEIASVTRDLVYVLNVDRLLQSPALVVDQELTALPMAEASSDE